MFCTDQLLSWHGHKPSLLSCQRALVLSPFGLCLWLSPRSASLPLTFKISSLVSNYKVTLAHLGENCERTEKYRDCVSVGGGNLIPPCRNKSSGHSFPQAQFSVLFTCLLPCKVTWHRSYSLTFCHTQLTLCGFPLTGRACVTHVLGMLGPPATTGIGSLPNATSFPPIDPFTPH